MKAPKEIYIQTELDICPECGEEATWKPDRWGSTDVKYIRDDLVLMRSDMIKQAIGPEHYRDEEV